MGFESVPIGQEPLPVEIENKITLSNQQVDYFYWGGIEDWVFPSFHTVYVSFSEPVVTVVSGNMYSNFKIRDRYMKDYTKYVSEVTWMDNDKRTVNRTNLNIEK